MKVVISSNFDPKYHFFIPIVNWCWQKLGVDVICFVPEIFVPDTKDILSRHFLVLEYLKGSTISFKQFKAPEHKQATYTQCSRLYGGLLGLNEDEQLIIGDVDMLNFKLPPINEEGFTIYGYDLVPPKQFPMCYISAKSKYWKEAFIGEGGTYQSKLDELLGDIECENMRGNYWSKDQQEAYDKINISQSITYVPRSNGQNQFALNRVDRTDLHWRDRLNKEVIDAHLWRDGYTDENFSQIMELLTFMYPDEQFDWLNSYRNEYLKLL